ncbi:E3 ubiquitin-protein ligase RING1-like [Humulus lupulus]|uniref:E3 ubiquitin-protein ligase RING1-like n=1 Tax=Humulus lupulus TaxID=3486 RepID=UPI002B4116E5|nr:E3 ubiquitin-protein ligase RING1-like [Humulus lupulus]
MATLVISNSNVRRPSNFPMIDQVFDLDEVLTLAEDSTPPSDGDDQTTEVVRDSVAAQPNKYTHATDHQTASSGTVTALNVEYSCMVCMESFHYSGGRSGVRISCGHVYHADCIAAWLSVCDSCPLCRCRISAAEQFSCAVGKQRN